MSERQEIPPCTQKQHHAHNETQSLEFTQVSKALEAIHLPSHPPMPGNLEKTLVAGTPSTSQSSQRPDSPNINITATSSNTSEELYDNQEENSSALSKSLPDTERLPVDLLQEKTNLLVEFLLQKYRTNEPITKEDMIDAVIREQREHFLDILSRASRQMELLFGVDVKEVDPTSHCYTLVNKLGLTYDSRLSDEDGVPKTGLLLFILGVILMKDNRVTEQEIWEVLNTMDLYPGTNHMIFGEPGKFITQDLVREKYIICQQVTNCNPPRLEFLWGPRAHAEVSKTKLLEFLTKFLHSDSIFSPSHLEEALKTEAERDHTIATPRAGTSASAMASSRAPSSSSSHP